MLDGTVKRNGVERTTPKFWFGRGLRVVWKLDVNDTILVGGVSWGGLIVNIQRPRGFLMVSRHTNL